MSEWDIDHIIPWAWSFNDTRSNLQALCPASESPRRDADAMRARARGARAAGRPYGLTDLASQVQSTPIDVASHPYQPEVAG